MSTLIDQAERDRFVEVQAKNISVIAPAGVGKTTSIVARIVHLAQLPEAQAVDRLSRLIVVTYSVRAAQQMQHRARVAIRAAKVSSRIQRAFQQTFFGTIHSYCVRLLERFGHYLGLPSRVGLLQDDTELWQRFLLRGLGQGIGGEENLRELFHFYAPERLYSLGKEVSPGDVVGVGRFPTLQLKRLLDYRGDSLHSATKKTIVRAQEAAALWVAAWGREERFRPLPKCPESDKAADFAAIWNATFAPLHEWLREAALAFGRRVANAYEEFRLAEAVMTYDDQVRLALRALDHPAVRRELAADNVSVLLDEAQDTDPRQFEVLQKVAGLGAGIKQSAEQTFCIVGDFQQAIYAPRSDLGVYRNVHRLVTAEPRGTSSRLRVTFRCDAAIIALVNRLFPSVLNDANGQCTFETLVARDGAGPGQVVRWACPGEPDRGEGQKITAEMRARHEARFIAARIQALGPAGLGASDWSQVAILCPRKNWLLEVQRELVALEVPVQLHSASEQQRDQTPVAWLSALIWIAAHPEDTFEVAGVLREVLGVSDSDMALFTSGKGEKLCLYGPECTGSGRVESALRLLRKACAEADSLPLHEAVERLVEKTQLRERLDSIEDLRLENAGRELDDFMALIATRSAGGATLTGLAEELRLGLAQSSSSEEEIREGIQLLTSYKAKGLEWQAVIVPFIFRKIESKSLTYPRVVLLEGGGELVCRDRADFADRAEAFVTERDRQQLQRLLYVTATRAKRTLVLIDDESLFSSANRQVGWSAAELLGFFGAENRAAWTALAEEMKLPPDTVFPEATTVESDGEDFELPAMSTGDFRVAVSRAGEIPRRTTPHRLALKPLLDAEPAALIEREESAPTTDNPGIRYGTWWHEFIQTIPWQEPTASWQKKFAEAHRHSPQPDRSEREWELFRQSELAVRLAKPGLLIQVELPFLAQVTGQSCLEGVIDLAVYSPADGVWNVIDWKTNHVGAAGGKGLVEIYRGQIEAYAAALREILSAEVRGSLYLTQTGEWVPV